MALAISRYTDLIAVYDKRAETDNRYLGRLQRNNIECIDILELKQTIAEQYERIPLLFHCHGFSHLRLVSKVIRRIDKVMMSMHSFKHGMWYTKWVVLFAYFRFFRLVDMWQFLSHKGMDEFFWYRKPPLNTCVFPLSVEEFFMMRNRRNGTIRDVSGKQITRLAEKINIVCVAHFFHCKRHLFLLRSLRSILYGNNYLFLIGDGPLLEKVMSLAEELGIRDHVIFTGKVDIKTVHNILSHSNLSVTVSRSETFGWCLLESFCMDIPIVTTNVGIATSLIYDFLNGFVLDKNCTEKEFLEKTKLALKYLRKVDNSKTKHLYLWETYAKSAVNCYSNMLETL